MKIALCFLISYEHKLNKEQIWRDWIEPNKYIINVYFHYKDYNLITSEWIKKHTLPKNYLANTNYLHVVPAYLSLIQYAITNDYNNQWFCFLTESCVPIISPLRFQELFMENYSLSFMSWREAWWNINFVRRANLHHLQPQYRLANCPWFILNRQDVCRCIHFSKKYSIMYELICKGNVANESIFAIMLHNQNSLKNVINDDTTATDWSRMMSSTSPYLFKDGSKQDIQFIDDCLKNKKYTIFLRKVDSEFPENILINYIKKEDNNLSIIQKRRRRIFWLHKKMILNKYSYLPTYLYKYSVNYISIKFFYFIKNYYFFLFFFLFLFYFFIFLLYHYISNISNISTYYHTQYK